MFGVLCVVQVEVRCDFGVGSRNCRDSVWWMKWLCFFLQAEDGIRDAQESRGLGDVYKRQDDSRELSWGEWQKLALARALFRNAPVLILDEPVSALDSDTEYEIFSRFREVVRGRTTILISHRLTNISFADRIIVVSNGEISETGTHDELMKARGIYHRIYTRQASRCGE